MELFNNHIQVFWEKAVNKELSWNDFTAIVKRNSGFLSTHHIKWLINKSENVNNVTCCDDCRVALLDTLYVLALDCPSYDKTFANAIKNINHKKSEEHLEKLKKFARVA